MNKGIMVNLDDSHFWHSRKKIGSHPDLGDLKAYIRQYQNTQVTDLIFCVAARVACYPSKTIENELDKYHQKRENGYDVDYTDSLLAIPHELYEEKGLDPFSVWIDEARQCGIHPWLSFRMNDCHECYSPTSWLHPNFFHEHPEYRRVRHRNKDGYFDHCYDYEEPAIRKRMLDFITETLDRYDPDGIELDFQREMFCFRPGHENAAIMTQLLRDVHDLAESAAKKRGHEVWLAVRVPADPQDALEMGFDVAVWAEEGLLHSVCPTARFDTTDNDMPLTLWKHLLRGTGVLLTPGIELLNRIRPTDTAFRTDESHVVAAAAQYFSFGADAIYLYNYFDDPDPVDHPFWIPAEGQTQMAVRAEGMQRLLRILGDPELVTRSERCHLLTYRDIRPMWRPVASPLPLDLSKGEPYKTLRIVTGNVPENAKCLLRLGVNAPDGAALSVFVNSRPVRLLGCEQCVPAYTKDPLWVYEIEQLPEQAAVIEIAAPDSAIRIDYADITIKPQ